jgi:6-phosphogluconolactonase
MEIRVFSDVEALSVAAAGAVAEGVREAVARRGRCALVLTGGRTPRRMYELLAEHFALAIPWPQLDLFWGDERYVSPDDPRSNYGMTSRALLSRVSVSGGNVHPMPTGHRTPEGAARAYEALIRG